MLNQIEVWIFNATIGFLVSKNMGRSTKIVYRKKYKFHGGHFEIQDGYHQKESTSYFIGFLDLENIGVDTKHCQN